jgi:hypothetical protein
VLAAAVALACLAIYRGMPKLPRHNSAYLQVMRDHVWYYRQETGDYPKTARHLVEQVGPRMAAGGGLKLSLLHDDVVLLEGGKLKIEVEYYYVSPDTFPTTVWPVK